MEEAAEACHLGPPPGMKVTGFETHAYGVTALVVSRLGSGEPHAGGEFVYRSRDLRHWEYLHVMHSGNWSGRPGKNPVDTGEMWECPDFFALDGKHVLLYSTEGKVIWEVGEYDTKELKFHPQKQGLLDLGAYYAPKACLGLMASGFCLDGFRRSGPKQSIGQRGGRSDGVAAVLNVNSQGELEMNVVAGIDQLRSPVAINRRVEPVTQISGSMRGLSGEVGGSFSATGSPVILLISAHPDMLIRLGSQGTSLFIDDQVLPMKTAPNERVKFSVYLDGSIIKVSSTIASHSRSASIRPEQPRHQRSSPSCHRIRQSRWN